MLLHTLGHSTRSTEELARLLASHAIELLLDIRRFPRSRRQPHVDAERLPGGLAGAGYPVEYRHLPGLGGRRHSPAGTASPNDGWLSPGFRAFADYMLTPAFDRSLEELLALARSRRAAILCAEALPWRCHRSLVADALTVRGFPVRHILGPARCEAHRLTPFARVAGTRILYPARAPSGG